MKLALQANFRADLQAPLPFSPLLLHPILPQLLRLLLLQHFLQLLLSLPIS